MSDSPPASLPSPPDRPDDSHKGTYGTVVVVGGSRTMIGAPAIAAGAALRAGCGLAKLAVAGNVLPFCLVVEPSATGIALPDREDEQAFRDAMRQVDDDAVLAIGPGWGVGTMQQRCLHTLLRMGNRVVLDADGLNNLSKMPDGPRVPRCPMIMTPHPGEYRRLAEPLGIRLDPTDADRRHEAATLLAREYHSVIVLKGTHTIVTDGEQSYVNHSGNPALATAGSGDVLTGAIAALVAQGMSDYDAAVLGVYLHGLAADLWAGEHGRAGLAARDLIAQLPAALAHLRRGS